MRAKSFAIVLALFGLAAGGVVLAEDGERDDDEGGSPVRDVVRPQHDVTLDLRLAAGQTLAPGASVTTRVYVKNRGRRAERSASLSIYADSASSTPLWTGDVALHGRRRASRRIRIDVPDGASSLVAVASCENDDNPGNNMDVVEVGGSSGPGGSSHVSSAAAGAATYSANCASCHGAAAQGTRDGPMIRWRSAHEVLEAVREGEDGMPRFPGITSRDAQNIAAFLANPSAATTSPPPVTPPPSGSSPTYAAQVKALMTSSCTVCHQGSSAPKGVRLDTFATASSNASAALAAMQAGRMPPGGPLPAASVQLFADWIAGGKKQ